MYLDINILQSVPSSNINRDDTGAPKTAIYGGVMRSRVSSQAWKRAVRKAFVKDSKDSKWLGGLRIKEAPQLLADELQKQDASLSDEDAWNIALDVFDKIGITVDKKTGKTGALLMVSHGELEKLAEYVSDVDIDKIDKKELKKQLMSEKSLDMALFGRMVANDPSLNVDAACQVAHAISTHEVTPEFDFYAAVDDNQSDDENGAAMLGTIEYNSSTLFRYANVNVNELVNNLGSTAATLQGIKLFIKEFMMSMPTGKQNAFANKTVPQYVMITLRDDTPVNLVSAFEKPIISNDGYLQKSIDRLEEEYTATQKFVDQSVATFVLTTGDSKLHEQTENKEDLLDKVVTVLQKRIENENTND